MKSILSLDVGKKYTEVIICGRSKQAIPYGAGYTDEVKIYLIRTLCALKPLASAIKGPSWHIVY